MTFIKDDFFDKLHPEAKVSYREKVGFWPWQWFNKKQILVNEDSVEVENDNVGFLAGKIKNFPLFNPIPLILHGVFDVLPSSLGGKSFLNKSKKTLTLAEFQEQYPDLYKETFGDIEPSPLV